MKDPKYDLEGGGSICTAVGARLVRAWAWTSHAPTVETKQTHYHLEERLMEFSVRVIRVTESMHRSPAGTYVADQLLRSGTSPYGHHGEAEGAESRDDFIHKLKVCYKELREARRWLRLVQRTPLVAKPELLEVLLTEAGELVRIFAASLRTAENNRPVKKPLPTSRRASP